MEINVFTDTKVWIRPCLVHFVARIKREGGRIFIRLTKLYRLCNSIIKVELIDGI